MKNILIIILFGLICLSCDEFLNIGPDNSDLSAEIVFKNDNTAISALEAVYHELQFEGFGSGNGTSISYLGNTLSDDSKEYTDTSSKYEFFTNTVRADNSTNNGIWSSLYSQIYLINALLEGIRDNDFISLETKNRIEGEAKFLRSFHYYYLTLLYGDIPLILTTAYNENKTLPRSSIEEVYVQIKTDLKDALEVLPEDYRYAEGEHIRPTKYAAYTLMARMALWQKEYEDAIRFSDTVINSKNYELLPLDEVFKANSLETIWSLVPGNPNSGAYEGYTYIIENNPATPYTTATSALTEDFITIWESQDLRQSHWINVYSEENDHYYYPFKYKIKAGGDTEEYSMVMRLAELYLIRAEAYSMSNAPEKALADLNTIRNRAGLADWSIADIPDIKEAVLEERRRELFSEWGHRWLDLKRFGKLDEVLGEKKSSWSSHAKLLPIPEQDLLRDPFLTQNPGY